MKVRGLGGRFSRSTEVVVDSTLPDSKVIKSHLRKVESRRRRLPCEGKFGDVVADLGGRFCSSTGLIFACARPLDECPPLGLVSEEAGEADMN